MASTTWDLADTWYQWTNTTAATNQTVTEYTNAWTYWNSTATTTYIQPSPTPEQIAWHRRRTEARAEQLHAQKAKQAEAKKRAEDLLVSCLSDEQQEDYARNKRFRVRGSRGGVYDIHQGTVYQVNGEFTNGRPRYSHSICIHGSGVPEPDNMLAKKLMLETDEDEFRRIGNFSHH